MRVYIRDKDTKSGTTFALCEINNVLCDLDKPILLGKSDDWFVAPAVISFTLGAAGLGVSIFLRNKEDAKDIMDALLKYGYYDFSSFVKQTFFDYAAIKEETDALLAFAKEWNFKNTYTN